MRSVVSQEFRKCFDRLPTDVQSRARKVYKLWLANPSHRSINFRQLNPHNVFSARIGLHYRALCVQVEPEVFVWEWIGSHSDYDKLVDSL